MEEPRLQAIFDLMRQYDLLKFAYPGLAWHDALAQTQDAGLRLGILVLSLGDSGANFLRSLRVSKNTAQEILGAWRVWQEAQSPLHRLTDFQKKLLHLYCPDLPQLALETCLLCGNDLRELGVCGRHISDSLGRVRSAQWSGKIATREGALKLLAHTL